MSPDNLLKSTSGLEQPQALALLDKAIASRPDERLQDARGNLLYSAGWINRILDGFADRIGWPRGDVLGRSSLASANSTIAIEESIASFEAALSKNPNVAKIHYQLGRAQEISKNIPAAKRSYSRSLELAPRMPFAQYHLARLFENEGDEDAALALYQALIAEHQDFIEAKIAAANILRRRGHSTSAADLYASALTVRRAVFNNKWRLLSHVNLDEPVPVEGNYKGFALWFEFDHFVAIPIQLPASPVTSPVKLSTWARTVRYLASFYQRLLITRRIPPFAKRILRSIVEPILGARQRLRHSLLERKKARIKPLRAANLQALKSRIDQMPTQ